MNEWWAGGSLVQTGETYHWFLLGLICPPESRHHLALNRRERNNDTPVKSHNYPAVPQFTVVFCVESPLAFEKEPFLFFLNTTSVTLV